MLKQSWTAELTPYPKKVLRVPYILSPEVTSLIESARTPFQRTLLTALYATGLRRAELANLKNHRHRQSRQCDARSGR